MRLVNVGVSTSRVCGVRDYGRLLAGGLEQRGHEVRTEWLERPCSLEASAAFVRRIAQVASRDGGADAILWQYASFSYATRGISSLALPVAAALSRTHLPVLGVLHEVAYPFGRGSRGELWAASQHAALPAVVGACSALVVTVEERAEWLRRQALLPHRPVGFAPVFSNLPAARAGVRPAEGSFRIGIFGYRERAAAMVVEAVAGLAAGTAPVELRLLGGPGPDSDAARAFVRAAEQAGIPERLSFSGILPDTELADELARCHVLVFGAPSGPSPRNGTLAAMLAAARPVVAWDGPETWPALASARAVVLVEPTAPGLGAALGSLVESEREREALAERGLGFYEHHQSLAVVSELVDAMLQEACLQPRRGRQPGRRVPRRRR